MEETMEETVSRKDQYTRWCTYCGNIFHRDEHLERHIRTHSNSKPYHCQLCGLAYSRAEQLKKHYNRDHGKNEHGEKCTPTAPNPRPRVPMACRSCQKAKTGCGTERPCRRCEVKGITCVAQVRKSRGSKKNPKAPHLNGSKSPSPPRDWREPSDPVTEWSNSPTPGIDGDPSIQQTRQDSVWDLGNHGLPDMRASPQGVAQPRHSLGGELLGGSPPSAFYGHSTVQPTLAGSGNFAQGNFDHGTGPAWPNMSFGYSHFNMDTHFPQDMVNPSMMSMSPSSGHNFMPGIDHQQVFAGGFDNTAPESYGPINRRPRSPDQNNSMFYQNAPTVLWFG